MRHLIYRAFLTFAVFIPLVVHGIRTVSAEEGDVPQNKAVLETSKTEGFKLSSKAAETIGVQTRRIDSAPEFSVPKSALVYSLDRIAVYRLRHDWFKLISVEIVKEAGKEAVLRSPEIKPGDQVAERGAALLRVAEMEAFGGGE